MRVKLKGINKKKVRLASGEEVTYYYFGKGGPRLRGKPGDEQFMADYHAAINRKVDPGRGTLMSLLMAYQDSPAFNDLAPRTQSDYIKHIKDIEDKLGEFPLSGLPDRRAREIFTNWRDENVMRSRRQGDYGWQVLARVLSWAKDKGKISVNPCERGGRFYRGSRVANIWTDDDEARFLAAAPAHLHLPLQIALWTGQRQGDILALNWTQYDGRTIRLKQGKTGMRVAIPVAEQLKARLDPIRQKVGIVVLNLDGEPWRSGFSGFFHKKVRAAGIVGVTFSDTRGTAVTRLAKVGCTVPEIASLTGHSLQDVNAILDKHYLNRDEGLAASAIRKLETRTKIPERTPE